MKKVLQLVMVSCFLCLAGTVASVCLSTSTDCLPTVSRQPDTSRTLAAPIFVFNDQSHEFTFQYDWWMRAYLPAERYVVTSNLATLSQHRLEGYNIVVLEMHSTGVPFPDDEIALVEQFVRQGGGLLLIGNGYFWAQKHPGEPYPLNRLSQKLGIEFTPNNATGQLRLSKHTITDGVSTFEQKDSPAGEFDTGTMRLRNPSAEKLVVDEGGAPILTCGSRGRGRIVAVSQVNLLSPEHLGPPLRNERLVQNIFAWLSEGTLPFGKAVPDTSAAAAESARRILPEKKITIGKVDYFYAESLKARAEFIHSMFPKISAMLDSITGVGPIFDFRVILLASGSGGYSGGDEIGIGCLAEESYVVRVIAHELVHSWVNPGPLPNYFNEAWASLIAIRVATQLGYTAKARAERESFQGAFQKEDPGTTQLDLNNPPKAEAGIPAYTGKAMWVAEQMEERYGRDLFRRLFTTKRKAWSSMEQLTMKDFIELLSASVGEDLHPFFVGIGTTF